MLQMKKCLLQKLNARKDFFIIATSFLEKSQHLQFISDLQTLKLSLLANYMITVLKLKHLIQ